LENLVTQLLLERPENPSPFMLKWLSEQAKTKEATVLTEGVNELTDLKAELEQLKKEVSQLEEEVGDNSPGKKGGEGDSEEEEEEDDDADVEDLPPPDAYKNKGPRTSVSAEAYGVWNKRGDFTAPVYPKTDDQKKRIRDVLHKSFLFSSLETAEVNTVIDAMQEKAVEAGTRLIEQGDDGDLLYVVEEGQMDCFKIDGEDKKVKECKAGDAFGELALLYNCPRAASVVAQDKSILWQLDRESFNHIVKDAVSKRRQLYEDFLKSVPFLQSLEAYERNSMCDVLSPENFKSGEIMMTQGDAGDKFYLLVEGEAVASKMYSGSAAQDVMDYKVGDYFGELSLLRNEPRAATVTAKTDCKVLTMTRKTFKQLLGPLEDILLRNAKAYK